MTTCRDRNRCALPFFPGLYIIFYWRKREELIQFTVPQYTTRPESRLLFSKTSQKPSGNISRNWLDLSGGNLFVTQLLLDRDLMIFCYCFLCLTMTLFLRKQIIFYRISAGSVRHALQRFRFLPTNKSFGTIELSSCTSTCEKPFLPVCCSCSHSGNEEAVTRKERDCNL